MFMITERFCFYVVSIVTNPKTRALEKGDNQWLLIGNFKFYIEIFLCIYFKFNKSSISLSFCIILKNQGRLLTRKLSRNEFLGIFHCKTSDGLFAYSMDLQRDNERNFCLCGHGSFDFWGRGEWFWKNMHATVPLPKKIHPCEPKKKPFFSWKRIQCHACTRLDKKKFTKNNVLQITLSVSQKSNWLPLIITV